MLTLNPEVSKIRWREFVELGHLKSILPEAPKCHMGYNKQMNIKSAKFVRGITKEADILTDKIPQILFIGRSNVGKSSVINAFTRTKNLAISSSTPGRTRQINVFLINSQFYLVDLPGYGYASGSVDNRVKLRDLISWYLFMRHYEARRVVLIIDIEIGLQESDLHIIQLLEEERADFIVVANKSDKLKHQKLLKNLEEVKKQVKGRTVIPFSAKKNIGISELTTAAMKDIKFVKKEAEIVPLEMNRYPDVELD